MVADTVEQNLSVRRLDENGEKDNLKARQITNKVVLVRSYIADDDVKRTFLDIQN